MGRVAAWSRVGVLGLAVLVRAAQNSLGEYSQSRLIQTDIAGLETLLRAENEVVLAIWSRWSSEGRICHIPLKICVNKMSLKYLCSHIS